MIPVLVVCDDLWHPAEVIEMGFASLDADKFSFHFVKVAKDILTPERIAGYPVIVCCKGNSVSSFNSAPWFEEGVTEVGPKEFGEYVRSGGGFVALHACNTTREGQPMTDFIGNTFVGHPPRCGVDVTITAKNPVTDGIADFHIRDEHYGINVVAEDAQTFMLTSSETGGEQVGGYTREIGEGRLCVLTPGHTLDVFLNPEFNKLLTNAIEWCAKKR
jgi:type 1 glutamine amidotransferase